MRSKDFELAGGGALGRDHRTSFRNYQDAYFIEEFGEYTIAVVTDGCSSGSSPGSSRNEIGATVGGKIFVACLAHALDCRDEYIPDINEIFERSVEWAANKIDIVATMMSPNGRVKRIVQDHFLFTITGVLFLADVAYFFSLGDGIIYVNGEERRSGPFNNAPPYLAYRLLESVEGFEQGDLKIEILDAISLSDLEHFAIGCDGVYDLFCAESKKLPGMDGQVPPLSSFWENDRYFGGNPDLVSRQLRLISRDWPKKDPEAGLLPDDTTLIVGRKRRED